MIIVYSDRSRARLSEIHDYIAGHNPVAATRTIDRITQLIGHLADAPMLGPRWPHGLHRFLSVPGLPYRVHCRVEPKSGQVIIITIAHTAQRLPRLR